MGKMGRTRSNGENLGDKIEELDAHLDKMAGKESHAKIKTLPPTHLF